MSKTFEEIGQEIGKLVDEKAESYGDSLTRVESMMQVLYPHGITTNQMQYALIVVRMLDKVCRISNGHLKDSFEDIGGYSIRAVEKVRSIKPFDIGNCLDCGEFREFGHHCGVEQFHCQNNDDIPEVTSETSQCVLCKCKLTQESSKKTGYCIPCRGGMASE